jgi:hypothetical protein
MNAMIGWRDENAIEHAELGHELSMYPVLVEQIDQGDDRKNKGRNAR